MNLIQQIKDKAKKLQKRIVLPESSDPRILSAADQAIKEGLAEIILTGAPEDVLNKANELGLQFLQKAKIVDPANHPKKNDYINLLLEIRKGKGLTKDEATQLVENPLYLACLMIKAGDADGKVAGAINATGDVLRPAFQIIKTAPGISVVSGMFLMILQDQQWGENGVMLFADCAVNPNPNEKQLAEIAISTARSAQTIAGMTPKVAMLSFSTKGSAAHENVTKVVNATAIAKEKDPSLLIEGELQVDAAIVPSVSEQKAPDSPLKGKANVLVFPTLEAGNIAYKLAQRLAGATAIGPILQGIAAPVNDLSRGCSVEDILISIAVTANQAAG
jgi:phosphate acetyltransferase